MRILEATAGGRSYWHDKDHPETVFIDMRVERDDKFVVRGYDQNNPDVERTGQYTVLPHLQADFRNLPFPDRVFDLVVFDPPHFVTNNGMEKLSGIIKRKYGCLHAETWPRDIHDAFVELFRVMADHATLTFKFSDVDIGFEEILSVIPQEPLYGTTIKSTTHSTRWITFNKPIKMRKSVSEEPDAKVPKYD